MRLLILLAFAALFFGCQTDKTAQKAIVAEVNMTNPLREDSKASASATSPAAINLRMGEATASRGQEICLPIVAQNFRNLIGLQYTIQWDSTALEFASVRKFGLPGYGPANFGDRFASRGYLSTLWHEAGLQGVSINDGSTLFELCLINRAKPDSETEIRFTNGPTTFEVISADMSQWKLRYANGRVVSE